MIVNLHTMMKVWLLLLYSGILQFSLTENRLRYFTYLKEHRNWTEAKAKCENEGGSLLSLYDEEDDNMIFNLTRSEHINFKVWLGLKRKPSNVSIWSNGESVIFNKSNISIKNGEQVCEAFENGIWRGFNCSEKKSFMCQNGSNYTLEDTEKKNWCQAMQHCRTHFTDLASISDKQQNEDLRQESQGESFWIGLQHDKLQWEDNSCSTYREVIKDYNDCIWYMVEKKTSLWKGHTCESTAGIICSKGSVKIRVIYESKTWEQALNYCTANHSRLLWIEDQWDQEAVQQWLNFTYTGSKNRFWIGLRQSSVFGFWMWSDRIVFMNNENWENGTQPEMPLSNQCGAINAETYKWSDENCLNQLPFICEEDIIYMNT